MSLLPPLPALRAFESTARLGSVTRAAQELHLTHSAVSHQIKALEDLVAVPLFVREGKKLSLTATGREYAYQIRQALGFIAEATERTGLGARVQAQAESLKIAVLPSFATHWLVPRLRSWYERYPHIELHLSASLEMVDFERDNADCAIRMGQFSREGLHEVAVMRDWYLLVAGQSDERYDRAQSLQEAVAVGVCIGGLNSWLQWAQRYALDLPSARNLLCNDSNVALAAAEQNFGLLLTRLSIAAQGLVAGRIKQVTDAVSPYETPYFLVYPDRSANLERVRLFQAWLCEQGLAFEQYAFSRGSLSL